MGRKLFRRLAWAMLALVLLPPALLGLAAAALEFPWGQEALRRLVVHASGVEIAALQGSPLRRATLSGIALSDRQGRWLAIDRVTLAWDAPALLRRRVSVRALEIEGLALARLPAGEPAEPGASALPALPARLPVAVSIAGLRIIDATIAAAITGAAEASRIDAEAYAAFDRTARGEALLEARFTGPGDGRARLVLRREAALSLRLSLAEPAQGFIAALAGLPALGALSAEITAEGPPDRAIVDGRLSADAGLSARISGRLDAEGAANALDLSLQASGAALAAIAGRPAPAGMVSAEAAISGALLAPRIAARLTAEDVRPPAPLAPLGTVRADASLAVRADGLEFTGVNLSAEALSAEGHGVLPERGEPQGALRLSIPRIQAVLPDTGLTGGIVATATAGADGWIVLDADLHAIEGPGPTAVLLGEAARLAARMRPEGAGLRLAMLRLDGQAITLDAEGLAGERLELAGKLSLPLLTALAPGLDGSAEAELALSGPAADPDARVTLEVPRITVGALPPGTIRLEAVARRLAQHPDIDATGAGALAGEPLSLALRVQPQPDGTILLPRAALRWGMAQLDAAGRVLEDGRPDLAAKLLVPKLEPLGAVLGRALAGGITAEAEARPQGEGIRASLALDATRLVLPGARAGRITLKAAAEGAMESPLLEARLGLEGVAAGGLVTGGTITLQGPPRGLAISAALDGADHALRAEALAELPARLRLSSLALRWRTESVRLAAPATVTLDPPAVDRLVLDLAGGGRIEAAGRAGEPLDLSVRIARLPLAIASLAAPDLALAGTLDAEARITGTQAAPAARLDATARGVGLAGTPTADITATARLEAGEVRANATLTSGSAARLNLAAAAPLAAPQTGRASLGGTVSLALLDPLLAPDGREARGTIRLALAMENRRLSGQARLSDGRFSDGVLGLALGGIDGTLAAQDDVLRLDLAARTGAGRLALSGTVRPLEPRIPADLRLVANDARIALGELLSTRFGADLHASGGLLDTLDVTGRIDVARADITLPDRMPPDIVELPVQVLGAPPPPPPQPEAGPKRIALGIAIDAPRAVFVRGQGLDAELGGALRLAGTAADPRITGALAMRRGTLDRLGQTFTFRRGRLDFDGAAGFDPALDFEAARVAAGLTALIRVTGRPSSPKIQLASEPDAPSDEILSRLLFGRPQGTLSAAEAIQLARAAAELSGLASPGGGVVDRLRAGLGLDRLSVGANADGKAAVEAGRYVAEGVYVGARQGADGSPQATIQLEVLPGVSVGADIGGQASDRVNATIGFDY